MAPQVRKFAPKPDNLRSITRTYMGEGEGQVLQVIVDLCMDAMIALVHKSEYVCMCTLVPTHVHPHTCTQVC